MKTRTRVAARRATLILCALAVLALVAVQPARAATIYWDANGATAGQTDGAGAWLNANQWWTGAANVNWTSGGDAVFGWGGAGGAVTLASPTTVNSLTLNSFTGTYTLGTAGQTITLNNGITKNAGGTAATIISPITLGGTQNWTNNSAGLLTVGTGAVTNGGYLLTIGGSGNTTVSSVIGGTGGITKTGAGILTLSGANTFTGQLTVQTGTLSIGSINNVSANGTLGNSALPVILGSSGNTGTLQYTGATATSTKPFTLATGGTGAFEVTTGANTLTLSGLINGDGGLTKTGAGTLTLSGVNTYAGATTVNAGTLKLDFSAAGAPTSDIISSSSALVLGGGTLNLTGKASTTNSQTVNGATINAGISAITLTANATANPLSLSLGAITRNVGSRLKITQPTGTLSASNGLQTTSGTAGETLLDNGVAYATIGTTDWAGKDSTNAWIAPPTYTAATTTSLSGNASINTDLLTSTLSSNTTITSLRIAAYRGGTVKINDGCTLTTGGIMLSSSNASNGNHSNINGPGSLMGPAGRDLVVIQNQVGSNSELYIAAPIVNNTSATGLTADGGSTGRTLFLSGSNTYTGTTRILSGAIQIGIGGTTGSISPDSDIVNNGTLAFNRSDDITFSNNISGAGSLTKSGAGNVLLPNGNTYSGGTTVSGGTLQIGTNDAVGTGLLTLAGGAIEPYGDSRSLTCTVSLTGAATSSIVGSQDLTFSSFRQNYVGTSTLANNLAAGKTLTINGTVTITQQNSPSTLGISGTGYTVINGALTNPQNAGSLIKSGAGTLVLAGANTFTGATSITAGKLKIDTTGTINTTSSLTINGPTAEFMYNNSTTAFSKAITFTQGTLSGTGKIATAVSVGSNATLSPGGSPGTLTVNNANETWAGGGTYFWQLLDATGTLPGTDWDLAAVTGTGKLAVTATSGSPFNVVLQTLSSIGPPEVQGTPVNWNAGVQQSWKIASSANAITGWDVDDGLASALFAIDATNFVGAHPTATFSVSKTNNDVFLNYVPEPATMALLALGGLGLLLSRKRK